MIENIANMDCASYASNQHPPRQPYLRDDLRREVANEAVEEVHERGDHIGLAATRCNKRDVQKEGMITLVSTMLKQNGHDVSDTRPKRCVFLSCVCDEYKKRLGNYLFFGSGVLQNDFASKPRA